MLLGSKRRQVWGSVPKVLNLGCLRLPGKCNFAVWGLHTKESHSKRLHELSAESHQAKKFRMLAICTKAAPRRRAGTPDAEAAVFVRSAGEGWLTFAAVQEYAERLMPFYKLIAPKRTAFSVPLPIPPLFGHDIPNDGAQASDSGLDNLQLEILSEPEDGLTSGTRSRDRGGRKFLAVFCWRSAARGRPQSKACAARRGREERGSQGGEEGGWEIPLQQFLNSFFGPMP